MAEQEEKKKPAAAPKRPKKTREGYKCQYCDFAHEYAVQVYRHLHIAHGIKFRQTRSEKDGLYRWQTCCKAPGWILLKEWIPLHAEAMKQGFDEVCENCGELR